MRRRAVAVSGAAFAALLLVVAGLAFPTVDSGAASRPVELPQELEHLVFMACLPGLYTGTGDAAIDPAPNPGGVTAEQGLLFASDSSEGSGGAPSVRIESVGDWSVSVNSAGAYLRSRRSGGNPERTSSIAAAVIPAAQSLYDCMAPYRFEATSSVQPRSGAELLQLYRYDTAVLWPCLTSHGIDVGPRPSRAQFTASSSALVADPLATVPVTKKMLSRLVPALRACPLRPAYLG